ncbi:MAG: NAD(P)H-binding protein [Sphingomonadaceae bacterium]|nr:NAD(P)H-binding protein [Sphingomonadaceae bacterium]
MLAITGGTGFVGARLIALAVEAGHSVRALTRRPQPERAGVGWVPGDLADADALRALCDGADAVIHVAGAINAADRAGFWRTNVDCTRAMLAAAAGAGVRRFIQVSSLAAREPALSDYGASKAAADEIVTASPLDWSIVRPPAVYGPGDRESFELIRAVSRGFAPAIGAGRFSLVYVDDLGRALMALASAPAVSGLRTVFEISDGQPGGCSHAEFARAVGEAVGRQPVVLPVPPALLRAAASLNAAALRALGRTPKLTPDRARYFAHADWTADPAALIATGLWRPEVPLRDGLARAVAWYRSEGWLA